MQTFTSNLRARPGRHAALLLVAASLIGASGTSASDEFWVTKTRFGVAAGTGSEPPLRVRVVTTKQRTALRTRRIKVFVEVTEPQIVRFSGRARGGTQAERQPIVRERQARFVNRRSGTVVLRLTPQGRTRLSGCGDQRVLVTGIGRPVSSTQTLVFAKSRSFRTLRGDPARCGGG